MTNNRMRGMRDEVKERKEARTKARRHEDDLSSRWRSMINRLLHVLRAVRSSRRWQKTMRNFSEASRKKKFAFVASWLRARLFLKHKKDDEKRVRRKRTLFSSYDGRAYFLKLSSTATATATVAPTIGLLPMPISPIISTCAGTEEEPANCASECIRPIVSVMP